MPSAFVLVSCETDASELFATELKKMPGVDYAVRVSGVYEFFVKVNSATDEDLKNIVMQIRTNNWVRSSSTLMIARSYSTGAS
jgi:DNA-binding Lrp family transcriptional regulator